jgi:uncharacterized protein (DUF305 family)
MSTEVASVPAGTSAEPAAGATRRRWGGLGLLILALVVGILLGYAVSVLTRTGEATPTDTSAEAGFTRDMINHHSQAVEMGLIAFDRASLPGVRFVGYDIATAQQGEIGMMRQWLRGWQLLPTGTEPPMTWMDSGEILAAGELMPGMASQDEMNALREATGEDVDRRFLALMVDHHLGGIHMIDGVLELSDDPDVTELAETMKRNQQGEIEVLRDLQQRLDDA